MSTTGANASKALLIEIIPPEKTSMDRIMMCDCCRERKFASQFDQDCCGICIDCIDADPVCFGGDSELKHRS